jgi:uncharacterized protein (TIGR03435 family)
MANVFWGCRLTSAGKLRLLAAGWMPVLASMVFAQPLAAQNAARPPTVKDAYVPTMTFDVASVRQSPEADSYMVSGSFTHRSSTFRATNFDIMNLLGFAYSVRWDQVVGRPDWRAMFNVEAKGDDAEDERLAKLSGDQQWLEQQHMLQALLADRFKLKVHWETREGQTYNLVVVKSGLKMHEAKGEPPSPEEIKRFGDRPIPAIYQQGDSRVGFDFIAHDCSISDLVPILAGQFGHPVADKTGLTGKYSFKLRYHDIRLSDRSADDQDTVPTLDTALQDQLGLKLEPAKGAVQFLVIDHIEKPSEN